MNENIDLTKILKDCPKGWEFYSSIYGEVKFETIKFQCLKYRYDPHTPVHCHCQIVEEDPRPIKFTVQDVERCVSSAGEHIKGKGECTFFPSKDQRDWSKFSAPWYKKGKFDPKTLKPFDRVLVRDGRLECWRCAFYSHQRKESTSFKYATTANSYVRCIPYNDDTKHLVGTNEEAPEYYR